MRSKKLARQIKKAFDSETLEADVASSASWLAAQGEAHRSASLLVGGLSAFLDTIDAAYEQYETNLTHAQRSLALSGEEVEQRNRQLRIEVKKVSDLLNNMKQAVFSVEPTGNIVAPVSKFAEAVFGCDIVGKNLFEVLYTELDPTTEESALLRSAMISVFGETEIQWVVMEDFFPKRVVIATQSGERKTLRVSVSPLWDESERLERVMFVIEDVTALEALEKAMSDERERADRAMRMIQELLAIPRQSLIEFLENSRKLIADVMREIGSQTSSLDVNPLLRRLHTIKGNSRAFKLSEISGAAHMAESGLQAIRAGTSVADQIKAANGAANYLKLLIDEYSEIARRVFGIESEFDQGAGSLGGHRSFGHEQVRWLSNLIARLGSSIKDPELARAAELLEDLRYRKFSTLSHELESTATDVAKSLNKEIIFRFNADDVVRIESDTMADLKSCLVQLIRNAVDHGIEMPAERTQSGKFRSGLVEVSARRDGATDVISVRDDGPGINPENLKFRAVTLGLISDEKASKLSRQEACELIFIPGFSSKTTATEFSGRGVGLDVVKETARRLGWSIDLTSNSEAGKSGTIFKISIPHPSK